MNWHENILLKLVAGIIGNYICALFIEKGASLFQNRKFEHKKAFGVFLIILAISALVKSILFY